MRSTANTRCATQPRRIAGALLLGALVWLAAAPALAQELSDEERVRWERQVEYVQTLIAAEPSIPLHYMRMAQAWSRLGQERRVLEYTEAAIQRGGNPLAADILVGDFYANQNRPGDALDRYLRVLKASSYQAHALTQIWFIVQATRLSDENVRLPVRLGDLILLLNQRGYYVAPQTTEARPGIVDSIITDGKRRLVAGDAEGAARAYEQAAAIDPWVPAIYRGLGVSYGRLGQVERAVGAYHLYVALAKNERDVPQVQNIINEYYQQLGGNRP